MKIKKINIIFIFMAVLLSIISNAYAATVTAPQTSTVPQPIANKTKDIWATVVVVVQVAAVATVVFAGVRYMFASTDQRADIKQGLVHLTIGAVLVFGATTIVRFIAGAAERAIQL